MKFMFILNPFRLAQFGRGGKPIDIPFHLDPDGKVIGHLECELMPAVVFPWEKLIDMGKDRKLLIPVR